MTLNKNLKLLFVCGSRGEWGYIRPILELCKKRKINYKLITTNMVLLDEHGSLINEIKKDFKVADKIMMSVNGDTLNSMTKSLGVYFTSFVDTLNRTKPDWIIIAGDRGEQFMSAIAGAYSYIPVAHIQAGERSGNIDGVVRHAIAKMSHIHFAANKDAAKRLEKLGEEKFRIFNVGAPQLDEIYNNQISYQFSKNKKNFFLVVFHPVTEEYKNNDKYIETICNTLNSFKNKKIWILPNNDAGNLIIKRKIIELRHKDVEIYENLTRSKYLGLLKKCELIIGNSSSGIIEAPSFKTPCINIGRRQIDRLQSNNVINIRCDEKEIKTAINKAVSDRFKNKLKKYNPYGDGKSSIKILEILQDTKIDEKLLIKRNTY